MRFKLPSTSDLLFETPPHLRPEVDLGLSAAPHTLTAQQRELDIGVTKWFNLVYGFALDAAVREGYNAYYINNALATGQLLVRSFFFQFGPGRTLPAHRTVDDIPDERATFIGTVEASEDRLYISGGKPKDLRPAMLYERRDDLYVPLSSLVPRDASNISDPTPKAVLLPEPFMYDTGETSIPPGLPDELRAAHALGTLANVVSFNLERGTMMQRGRVESIRPGDPLGLEQA